MPTFSEDTPGTQNPHGSAGEAQHTRHDNAKGLNDAARDHDTEPFGSDRDSAADQIENLARTASAAAEELQDRDTLGISHCISDIAESLSAFATSLRSKSAEEMLPRASRLAGVKLDGIRPTR